ncbi:MAG: serine/threonine-protein kinase [Polyangiaceae bacterium]
MREGDVIEQRFRLGRRAGAGAMGVVYLADDARTGRPVAVKVLRASDSSDTARFEREVDLLVALQHPSVVRYVAHGRTPAGEPWLAMEWLAGETLKERFERAPLDLREIVDVGLAVASALAGAHARGVVHRDVKPANVFLCAGSTDTVKLLDFGIARLRRWNGKTAAQLTEAGAAIGTPAYMSPEQARGDDVGAPSDVFSLGVVLFQLVAGNLPFASDDMVESLLRLTRERAPRLGEVAPRVPPPFAALVDAMLEPVPAARPEMLSVFGGLDRIRTDMGPGSARPLVASVRAKATVSLGLPTAQISPPGRDPSAQRSGSRAIALAGAAAVVVGGAIAIGLAVRNSNHPEPRRQSAAAPSGARPPAATAQPGPSAAEPSASASTGAGRFGFCPAAMAACDPLALDAHAAEPMDVLAACVESAHRHLPTARLTGFRGRVGGGKIDQARDGASECDFVDGDGRFRPIIINADQLSVPAPPPITMQLEPAQRTFLPERPPCAFATAWAAASADLVDPAATFAYALCDDPDGGTYPCWRFDVPRRAVSVDASTCAVRRSTAMEP